MTGAQAGLAYVLANPRVSCAVFGTTRLAHLKDNVDRDELPVTFILRKGRERADAAARRSSMSPAARKAVSARMKKYWAARRNR